MSTCTSCGSELPPEGRFCSSCGTPGPISSDEATFDFGPALSRKAVSPPPASKSRITSYGASQSAEGRFLPGSMVANRYRIVNLLGKGGMGEVYRADDLTLGQPVALKFLPDRALQDEAVLERFRNEVRISRKVSHPNVCRVYDVGDVDGQPFFTMEYVDGEDLSSLLRRIGRLPHDKALAIARQLCAGLAAAHGKGVLHRDMKPANVMLDGRGQVVITDFGLAGIADQISGNEVRSGTPAYMAPEQLAGQEVSVRSDIYSLGLVLYEVFTGKRAFGDKPTMVEKGGADRTPSRPSLVVRDLDPVVERVILRCLEIEPSARPATALSVAAALPGGDPLAAALAAGETPSPELVAASGETAGLRPAIAIACMAAVLIGLGLIVTLAIRISALERMRLEQPPEALAQKAREIVTRFGYDGHPLDTASGFTTDNDLQEYVEKSDKPRPDWDAVLAVRPPLLRYWYRQSPQYMVPTEISDLLMLSGVASKTDPAPITSNMINVELDPQGRLIYLQAIPPQKETPTGTPSTYNWGDLLQAAGLDAAQLQKAEPMWNSLATSDARAAWNGVWPGSQRPLHIEAAAWKGRPVFFQMMGDWTKPDRMQSPDGPNGKRTGQSILVLMVMALLVFAAYLAWNNYRQRRANLEGAFRLSAVMFALQMLIWMCRGHLVPAIDTFGMFLVALSGGLFVAGLTWALYLSLEPWVRRRWPHALISWSRLLSGQWRDPLVCRDLLFGVILGMVWILLFHLRSIPLMHLGRAPETGNVDYLMGGRFALGTGLLQIPLSILGTLQFFFLLFGLKVLLRKDWLAAIVFIALFALPPALNSRYLAVELPTQILVYAIAVLIVYRFGLVPLAIAIFTVDMLANVPFTADFSAWYMSTSIAAVLSVLALAAWGFYHSLGGEPLWKMDAKLG